MTCCTDICGSQRMELTDFGSPLAFPPVPPAGSQFWFRAECLSNYGRDFHEICEDIHFPLKQANVLS